MTTDKKREKLMNMVRDDFEATIYFAAAEDDCIDALWRKQDRLCTWIQVVDAMIVFAFFGSMLLILEVL